jgi:methionyl-tRNA formyltransferase
MRFVYMGTPPYAATILEYLLAHGRRPTLVVTQPDRVAGRGLRAAPPAVKVVAEAAGLPVFQPEKITTAAREQIVAERPEVILVAAFGKILRPALLEAPKFGCLNAHASLLPKYRGAAPVNWAICNGEAETGVTIMKMDEGVDTGPALARAVVPIAADDDASSLLQKLAAAAGPLFLETLDAWVAGAIAPQPQPADGASYAPMLKKEDGLIDWRLPARLLAARVRGLRPWPGAFTRRQGQTLKVLQAEVADAAGEPGAVLRAKKELVVAAGEGALRLLCLQLEGKKALDAAAFLNGVRVSEGERLGV